MELRTYNTGDHIWLAIRDNKQVVVKIISHDGWYWEEGMPAIERRK